MQKYTSLVHFITYKGVCVKKKTYKGVSEFRSNKSTRRRLKPTQLWLAIAVQQCCSQTNQIDKIWLDK